MLHRGCLCCDSPMVTMIVRVTCHCGFDVECRATETLWQLPGEPVDPSSATYQHTMHGPVAKARSGEEAA